MQEKHLFNHKKRFKNIENDCDEFVQSIETTDNLGATKQQHKIYTNISIPA